MKKLTAIESIIGIVMALMVIAALFNLFFNKPVTTQDVYQYIDHDARVVCYILENGNGISCLPLSEVNISE
jgi:flagellar basal body-associated protein FliL